MGVLRIPSFRVQRIESDPVDIRMEPHTAIGMHSECLSRSFGRHWNGDRLLRTILRDTVQVSVYAPQVPGCDYVDFNSSLDIRNLPGRCCVDA